MGTSRKTNKKNEMLQATHFGLTIKNVPDVIAKRLAALLFLCPRITPEHASVIIDMVANGKENLSDIEEYYDMDLDEIRDWSIDPDHIGPDFHSIMKNKLEAWTKAFRAPTDEEYEDIKLMFGPDKQMLYGEETKVKKPLYNCPKDIADYVKQFIKGQDEVIEQLSVPFFLHLESKQNHSTCRIKTPSLLMGPTGTGKSETIRIFGKACNCPVIRINTSEVVPTGWRGMHITDVIAKELSDDVTIQDLEYSVIVFHEFDKITHYNKKIISNCGTDADMDMMRDIMRFFETDHSLILENGIDPKTMAPQTYKLPTDNLLIIFDGAYSGIDRIIEKRMNIGTKIGFQALENPINLKNLMKHVTKEDLIEWGYSEELIGRIGNMVVMNPLSTEDIYSIMTTAKNNILRAHIDYCASKNIGLNFTDDAIHFIAEEAHKSGLGFRNVKTLLSKALRKLYYDKLFFETSSCSSSDTQKVIEITRQYVMDSLSNNGK